MAEDGVEFAIALKDEASSPAKAAAESLKSLGESAHHAGDDAKKLGDELHNAGDHAHKAHGLFSEMFEGIGEKLVFAELAVEAIKKIGEAASEAVEKVVDLGVEFVKFSLESSEFKENTEDAYAVTLGTAEKGKQTFEEITNIARAMHIPVEKAQGMAQHLLQLGLDNEGEIKGTVAAVSRLERAGLGEGADKLQRIIERSLAEGSFKVEGRKLAGVGVGLPDLYEDLGKRLGKSVPEVKALMQHGKIDTQVGIASITDLINNGKIAEVADKKFTLKDIATDWHNDWVSMTEDIDAGPLLGALRDFVGIFDQGTDSAKGLKEGITDTINTVIKWVAGAIDAVTIFVYKFETGFYEAEVAMAPAIKDIEKFTGHTDAMSTLADGALAFAKAITEGAIGIAWTIVEIEKLQEALSSSTFTVKGHEVGMGLVEGIVNGITGGVFGVVKAVHGLGAAALDEIKGMFGIHSPSKVMAEMGTHVTEGFAEGVEAGGGGGEVMRDNFAPPSAPTAPAGGGSRSIDLSGMHLEVHGVAHAEEIMTLLPSALVNVLEQAANEMGA